MPTFDVHIYREMRLKFTDIEAETHEAAAEAARNLSLKVTDDIDECDGETFYACVDVVGDDQYEQSRWIDFEGERLRANASKLLEALRACEVQLREYVAWHHRHAGGCSVEIESAWEEARNAITEATGKEPTRAPREEADKPLPSLVTLLWDFIENGESSYGLSFFDLRGKVRTAA